MDDEKYLFSITPLADLEGGGAIFSNGPPSDEGTLSNL